jgi:hypothetical protein
MCPDLHKLRALADEFGFALVVDDTIGNFANVDLIQSGLADAVCTSLTKLFNGRGDAMAGSVITNPNTEIGRWMQKDMESNHLDSEGLWPGDAIAVYENSADFLERSSKINETTEALADWLKDRDEILDIYYPKFTCPDGYNSVLKHDDCGGRHKAGYGGLFSIVLDDHICVRSFYDKIDLSKGPSLGTNFSLACPYTLLAHYHELDFAMSYDVQPNLIRFAIGLEDLEVMKEKFDTALRESRLHPKLPDAMAKNEQKREFCSLSNADCGPRKLVTQGYNNGIVGRQSFGRYQGGFFASLKHSSSSNYPRTRDFATKSQVPSIDAQFDLRCLGAVASKNIIRNNTSKIARTAVSVLRRRL